MFGDCITFMLEIIANINFCDNLQDYHYFAKTPNNCSSFLNCSNKTIYILFKQCENGNVG